MLDPVLMLWNAKMNQISILPSRDLLSLESKECMGREKSDLGMCDKCNDKKDK